MKKIVVITIVLFMVAFTASTSTASGWTDTLFGGASGGITATQQWDSSDTYFIWAVSTTDNINYTYEYIFNVPSKDISHLIIQCSDNFRDAGIFDVYGPATQGNSNPNMPADINGVKFENGMGSSDTGVFWTISFNSTHAPVWGSFYAKDGTNKVGSIHYPVTAWNSGFTSSAFDPKDYIWLTDKSDTMIAVPDSVVPEPSGFLVIATPLGLMLLSRFKRNSTK